MVDEVRVRGVTMRGHWRASHRERMEKIEHTGHTHLNRGDDVSGLLEYKITIDVIVLDEVATQSGRGSTYFTGGVDIYEQSLKYNCTGVYTTSYTSVNISWVGKEERSLYYMSSKSFVHLGDWLCGVVGIDQKEGGEYTGAIVEECVNRGTLEKRTDSVV
ncbi:hypothetical protein Tco_0632472 [Tanacetum coccineum]